MNFRAGIFDMDGTAISDEKVYGSAFKRILVELGAKESEVAWYPQVGGIGVEENWMPLLAKYRLKTDKTAEELATWTHREYIKHVDEVKLKPGFEKFSQAMKDRKLLMGLATSSTWRVAGAVFKQIHLDEFFDTVTTGEEVAVKKPSPEIFLLTAKKLSADPEKCVVFEDSPSGIEAAKAANMKSVGFFRDDEHKKEMEGSDILCRDFTGLSLEDVEKLFDD